VQASSASSERSFSKAGLIVVAKRMVLKPQNVDRLSLVGWHMAENNSLTKKKRKRDQQP